MILDWSIIVATAVGALIGFAGHWTSHRLSLKREQHSHRLAQGNQKDQQRSAALAARDDRIREKEQSAAAAILAAFERNTIGPLGDPEGLSDLQVRELVLVMAHQRLYFRDEEIRLRLRHANGILEYLSESPPDGFTRATVLWAVRTSVWPWLGAVLREEPLPDPTNGWGQLRFEFERLQEERNRKLRDRGVSAAEFLTQP